MLFLQEVMMVSSMIMQEMVLIRIIRRQFIPVKIKEKEKKYASNLFRS